MCPLTSTRQFTQFCKHEKCSGGLKAYLACPALPCPCPASPPVSPPCPSLSFPVLPILSRPHALLPCPCFCPSLPFLYLSCLLFQPFSLPCLPFPPTDDYLLFSLALILTLIPSLILYPDAALGLIPSLILSSSFPPPVLTHSSILFLSPCSNNFFTKAFIHLILTSPTFNIFYKHSCSVSHN